MSKRRSLRGSNDRSKTKCLTIFTTVIEVIRLKPVSRETILYGISEQADLTENIIFLFFFLWQVDVSLYRGKAHSIWD